ncbi:hypothetical protein [Lacipirellula parvula]|uniref:Uncharacterized protein n=1 Tax=Lacipirellula parvula TaxID=2650471 RepID=A0A5K7X6S8_9BACT|nr:hypothetical protein [Lacipirellula parvula]BBO32290.1 hypothetical protein PLANPX_1902 [Lacipirellula parvula]
MNQGDRSRSLSKSMLAIVLTKVVVTIIVVVGGERFAPAGESGDQRCCVSSSAWVLMSPAGSSLAATLDQLDVEHRWLRSDLRIAWRTGKPIASDLEKDQTPLAENETHCSAFAAAAADHLGVYLLHPPEHSHVLLADAQFDWILSPGGRKAGWQSVSGPLAAQKLANSGSLVVAVFKNSDPKLPGHIAVVRPNEKRVICVEACGPQITQAGFDNYRSTDLATGFDRHSGAWLPEGKGQVRFFSHPLDRARRP